MFPHCGWAQDQHGAVLCSIFPLLPEPQFLYLSLEQREEGAFPDPHLDMVL